MAPMPGVSSRRSSTGSKRGPSRPTWGCNAVAKAVIAIAGSSGLIGSALTAALRAADHEVLRIVRRTPTKSEELHWNPESGEFDAGSPAHGAGGVNLRRANRGPPRWGGAVK